MTTFQSIQYFWFFILFNLYKIYNQIKNNFSIYILRIKQIDPTPPTPPPTPTEIYLLDKHTCFNKNKTNENIHVETQIEPFFYDKPKYTKILKDSQNIYEKLWKTRILFENTPRGNVIMLYDIYKMGFCYYSDQQMITYDILNAVAMKYVVTFRCIDFFIDEKYYTSPFLKLYESVETKETHTQKRIHQQNNSIRQIHNQTLPMTKPPTTAAAEEPMTIKNRFLYQGKIANFSFTQKIPKKRVTIKHNTLNELFEKNPQMSYSEFKKSLNKTTSTSRPTNT